MRRVLFGVVAVVLATSSAQAADPGVLQLSVSGALKTRWSAQELWGDAKGWTEGQVDPKTFLRFLAAAKTIDLVLALPEAPAIVVREPKGGGARYRLGVLGPEMRDRSTRPRTPTGLRRVA
jgi:hypothetical protein